MKKFFLPILILLTTLMFSSCIIIGDFDTGSSSSSTSRRVTLRNDDPYYTIYRVDYTDKYSYTTSSPYDWKTCWKSSTDQDISFKLESGNSYYFRVYVESNFTGKQFYTDSSGKIYISSYSDVKLKYTGSDIQRDY